jgi:hypothetical protein
LTQLMFEAAIRDWQETRDYRPLLN